MKSYYKSVIIIISKSKEGFADGKSFNANYMTFKTFFMHSKNAFLKEAHSGFFFKYLEKIICGGQTNEQSKPCLWG